MMVMVNKNFRLGALISVVALLTIILFIGVQAKTRSSREAVAVRDRCLDVAKDTRAIFSETATYQSPFYYSEPSRESYEKNADLLIALDAFIGCIENDHAYSQSHPVSEYRQDAIVASDKITARNKEIHGQLCAPDDISNAAIAYSVLKKTWVESGYSDEEAARMAEQSDSAWCNK